MDSTPTSIQFVAQTTLPTHFGSLIVRAYRNVRTGQEPIAILSEHPVSADVPTVRIHDACFTSEVLGSLKCDCTQQLHLAIEYIQTHGGVLLYLHQEGRGIGLANKLAAYALQERGLDTVEANRALHLPDDARDYTDAVDILRQLNIKRLNLMTNNPRKIASLTALGIDVVSRVPLQSTSTPNNVSYLKTKASKMGHFLNFVPNKDID